jgi:GNAT superfamily N-acetyltransferase
MTYTSLAELDIMRGVGDAAFGALDEARVSKEPPAPQAERWIARRGDATVARLAAYRAADLRGAPGVSGLIGHYAAEEAEAGTALLQEAAQALVAEGARRVLAPMNGSTWGGYRVVLPPVSALESEEPPFLGEPWNAFDLAAQIERAGFYQAALYESRIVRDLAVPDAKAEARRRTLADAGITWEPLRPDQYESALVEIHELSLLAFADNLYYAPLPLDAFRAMYLPIRPLVDPDLVLLARDADRRLAGFAFAFPDPLGAAAGRPGRVVLKTLATAPAARGLGLGGVLMDEVRQRSHAKGFDAVIHALIHLGNVSRRLSERTAGVLRRYALYAWDPHGG